jgi:hypothetical protein
MTGPAKRVQPRQHQFDGREADRLEADWLLSLLRKKEKEYLASLAATIGKELGAKDYYRNRLRSKMLVLPAEWEVLRFIMHHFPGPTTHIVEIGCGWGQVLAMAAAAGYRCAGVDCAVSRVKGARLLGDLVDSDFKGAADRLRYFEGLFPNNWEDAKGAMRSTGQTVAIGFFSQLGYGQPEEFSDLCVAQLGQFDYVIMDPCRFFADRDRPAQDAFIEKMALSGISFCGDIVETQHHRFVGLATGDPAPLRQRIENHIQRRPLIDSVDTEPLLVRSTMTPIESGAMRVTEGVTTASMSHDLRWVHRGRINNGRYLLTATLRAGVRRASSILLHRDWNDQARIMVDLSKGGGRIVEVLGGTFNICELEIKKAGDWTRVDARVDVKNEPEIVGVVVFLVNEAGEYYYKGDGHSGLDVGVVRLAKD